MSVMSVTYRPLLLPLFFILFAASAAAQQGDPAGSSPGEKDREALKTSVEAAKVGKADADKLVQQLEKEKKEVAQEKIDLEKLETSVVSGKEISGDYTQVIRQKKEVLEKRESAIAAREQTLQEKIEAYEQAAAILEKRVQLRESKDLSLQDIRRMLESAKKLRWDTLREKEDLQNKITLMDLDIRAEEQAISTKKLLIDLKGDSDGTLASSISAKEALVSALRTELALVEERIHFIDIQVQLINDYISVVREKRWEILTYELFEKRPFKPKKRDLYSTLVFLLFLAASFSARRMRKSGKLSWGQLMNKAIDSVSGAVIFIGLPLFAAHWAAALLGYKRLGEYVCRNAAIVTGIAILFSLLLKSVETITEKAAGIFRGGEKDEDKLRYAMLRTASMIVVWGLLGLGTYSVINILGFEHEAAEFIHNVVQKPFFVLGSVNISVWVVIKVALILWVFGVTAHVIDGLLRRNVYERVGIDESTQYTISAAIKYLMLLVGVFVGLSALGVDLAALTVLAGTIGIGIGFGLQEIAKNFISGIVMLIERPVKVGDYIEVGGLPGRVRQINARSTVVDTFDNISVVVPNSEFMTQQVVNWSYSDKLTRIKLPVGVAYGSDTGLVRESLLEVAGEHPGVLKRPEPYVWFEGFGESSLNFCLFVWTNEPHNRLSIKSDINFMIDNKFREKKITIPFPQRDLHLKSGDISLKQ